jgi:hypothetical protein
LYYSEVGEYEHVADDAYVDFTGDASDRITGLAVAGAQLYVGKRQRIWIMAGSITAPTNRTTALGTNAQLPNSTHEVYRTLAATGPLEPAGGMVAIGEPPGIYFPAEAGFLRFDGEAVQNLSTDQIAPTWALFINAQRPLTHTVLSMAFDERTRTFYLACPAWGIDEGRPELLAYHALTKGWTTHGLNATVHGDQCMCVATALGAPLSLEVDSDANPLLVVRDVGPCALIVGTADGRVFESVEWETDDLQTPPWEWRTGDLELVPGRLAHCYRLHVYTGLPEAAAPVGVPLPARRPAGLRSNDAVGRFNCGFLYRLPPRQTTDTGADVIAEGNQNLFERLSQRAKVGRTGRTFQLFFKRYVNGSYGWVPNAGLAGFGLDFEPVGER